MVGREFVVDCGGEVLQLRSLRRASLETSPHGPLERPTALRIRRVGNLISPSVSSRTATHGASVYIVVTVSCFSTASKNAKVIDTIRLAGRSKGCGALDSPTTTGEEVPLQAIRTRGMARAWDCVLDDINETRFSSIMGAATVINRVDFASSQEKTLASFGRRN